MKGKKVIYENNFNTLKLNLKVTLIFPTDFSTFYWISFQKYSAFWNFKMLFRIQEAIASITYHTESDKKCNRSNTYIQTAATSFCPNNFFSQTNSQFREITDDIF